MHTSSGLKVKDLKKTYLLRRKSDEKTSRKKHCDSEIIAEAGRVFQRRIEKQRKNDRCRLEDASGKRNE